MEDKNRPITTLFMLVSVDGKISTGSADELDVDKDFPKIECKVLSDSYIRLRHKVIS